MGQRAVAEATRKKFGLSKFSHSTVCRTLKAFEQSIKKAGASNGDQSDITVKTSDKEIAVQDGTQADDRRFPTVNNTAKRRIDISMFIRGMLDGTNPVSINDISFIIVSKWYKKYRCLLI